jgi:hypothetical protein
VGRHVPIREGTFSETLRKEIEEECKRLLRN